MLLVRKEAIDSFDKNASRYHQGVYEKKRLEMLTKLNIQLNVLFVGQLKNLHKKAVLSFDENLKLELKKPNYNFAVAVESCLKGAQDLFLIGAKCKSFCLHFLYIVLLKKMTIYSPYFTRDRLVLCQ